MPTGTLSSVWAPAETDGERHLRRRCGKYGELAGQIARDLRDLAQIRDANSDQIKRLVHAKEVAESLEKELKELHKP